MQDISLLDGLKGAGFDPIVVDESTVLPEPASGAGKKVNIMPDSMKTPEGAAKVNAAMEAWEETHAPVANRAGRFIAQNQSLIKKALRMVDDEDGEAELDEILEEISDRDNKQEAFLRAVSGR